MDTSIRLIFPEFARLGNVCRFAVGTVCASWRNTYTNPRERSVAERPQMSETLLIEEQGHVLRATLNRPDKLNALNRELIDALRELFLSLYWRRDIRVVILCGAGRAFSAGLDLDHGKTATRDLTASQGLLEQRKLSEIVIAMRRCPQPIVALVDGPASGAGFALALASDIRLATPRTRMNAAFIRLGVSGCDVGVSYFLPRMVGSAVAAEYLFTGRFIDAEKARALHLVSDVVATDDIRAAGDAIVDELSKATPLSLRLTKDALNHSINATSLDAVIAMEDRNQVLGFRDDNFQEGIAAFMEKRAPRYADD